MVEKVLQTSPWAGSRVSARTGEKPAEGSASGRALSGASDAHARARGIEEEARRVT